MVDERTQGDVELVVDHYAELLGLERWSILVDWEEPADSSSYAKTNTVDGRYTAIVHVAEDFPSWPERVLHLAVVHELLHVALDPTNNIIRHDLTDFLSQETYNAVWNAYRRSHEYAVDALAHALTPLLPTPKET